ncbi:NADH:flavin oxidoreductase [Marinobacter sp. HL-58]|uniref:oxidoreductase n=1 Tax=Marinobacter sp. HL-58 TaxID=1479237 RepID=UPI0004854FB6|nr:NADH:flavin oxidoreductase [Marinobacter sp. HL-58]KPQ00036.1 MAG: Old Yellow Enzyme family NADH:flavin oxidoreductase [Marinobacter sp. HL-58]
MSNLTQPTTFTGMKLDNRFALAPMTRTSADPDGTPNGLMADHYEAYARGGFGLVITEGTYTDELASQGYANQPGIINDQQIEGWKTVVDRVHAAGSKIVIQLMHAGAQFQANRFTDQPLAPSAVSPKGQPLGFYGDQTAWTLPMAMTEEDIRAAIEGFAKAAANAKAAGFDGIELHGANGYLLNQFLSTHFNHRKDGYGGALANRLKVVIGTVRAVRDAVGPDYPVGIRLSQGTVTDPEYRLPEGEDGFRQIVTAVRDAGADFIHTTDGGVDQPAFEGSEHSLASVVQETGGVELVINGGIDETNSQSLAQQFPQALLAVGKKALANPDFVQRLKDGKAIADLDFAMLQPKATITNELAWRKANAA